MRGAGLGAWGAAVACVAPVGDRAWADAVTQTFQLAESGKIMSGGMAEWLKAAVLKTVELERVPGVRIPLPPPTYLLCIQ
jgi:hypothetical protein